MEPPPPAAPPLSATAAAAATHPTYPDSVESSPRSRNADSWDEPLLSSSTHGGGGAKLRLMCSYGGHIVPRPHDKSLCYVGGDTRIVVADRHSSLSDLTHRLSKTLLHGQPFTMKYQLPNEDLDSLISVTTDEDLDNMIDEYDRLKSSRLRLFLFPSKPDSASSIGSLLEDSTKSEDWFVNALNGSTATTTRGFSQSSSVNCLLGLDDDVLVGNSNSSAKGGGGGGGGGSGNGSKKGGGGGGQDVHSVPDSPMLETSSSFGSASSSPSLANLPPIRVHVEDQKAAAAAAAMGGGGIEEQFAHMGVGPHVVLSSPPTVVTTVAAAAAAAGGLPGEYANRVFSDDERSEQGVALGYRKIPQLQPQPPQSQSKPTGGIDLASPDSVSSDSSITNPLSRQRPMIYQDPVRVSVNPVDPKLSDPNPRVEIQQVQDAGYFLPNQFDHQHQQQLIQQQLNQQQQQQLNQHQQQQLNQQQHQLNQQHQQQQQLNQQHQQQQQLNQQHQQQQQLNQQQFLQAGAHYIHHQPTGAVPISSYYPVYPPQQQPLHPHHPLDQQYQPMFYIPAARQAQAYNYSVQQPNYNEAATSAATSNRPQTPPPPSSVMPPPPAAAYTTTRNATVSKPEMAAGMYRTAATTAAQPLVQAASSQLQQQYVGFSQIQHHPSQSATPPTANAGNYAYEFVDPMHAQMYYTQAMAPPQLAAQYQTMTSGPTMVLPEASSNQQLPMDNTKQQIRTTQP